ncbi:MAG: T9SS type A sorting domain-containing protein, partial [Candidatus Cloacimonetes bacterium]|nr:T9SS type A sorting domain-containing protein [Candidatus Cloacimonadota bacterium]
HPVTVKYAKIFVHTPGNAGIIVRVFAADAEGGMPGTQLAQYQYPASSILPGWNYVTLPENIDVENGQFFIGILETTNASMIGMDTSSTGGSYKRASGTSDWLPITEGNLMIRAIVETVTAGEDDIEPVVVFDARNYPNPFNPTTTINFSLPLAGHTELKIYNLKGQVVRTLVNQDMASGMHQIVWNGFDNNGKTVSSGVYFYRLTNNHNTLTRKMLLSK